MVQIINLLFALNGLNAIIKVRLTVCYKDGVLGVAVRYKDKSEKECSLNAVDSMYN